MDLVLTFSLFKNESNQKNKTKMNQTKMNQTEMNKTEMKIRKFQMKKVELRFYLIVNLMKFLDIKI